MSQGDRYKVVNSGAVADEFRQASNVARAAGQLSLFVASAKWIMEELSRTPGEFGESREERAGDGLVSRCGFAGCLYVEFAIHEQQRVVFLRRFRFRRR